MGRNTLVMKERYGHLTPGTLERAFQTVEEINNGGRETRRVMRAWSNERVSYGTLPPLASLTHATSGSPFLS